MSLLHAYLTDTVSRRRTTRDEWGEPSGTTDTALRAAVRHRTRLVRDAAGEQVVSSAQVLTEEMDVLHTDVIDTGDGTGYRAIVAIAKLRDFRAQGLEVYLA